MRVMLDDMVFPARLSATNETIGLKQAVLVIDERIVLLPEEVSIFGCVLVEATQQERQALKLAGFGVLTR